MPYGAALVMAAAVLWGTTGTAQAVASYGGSSLQLGAARLAVASLIFAGIVALRKVAWRKALGSRRTVAVVLLGAFCVAAYQPAFFLGVQRTGVGVGTLTAIGSAPVFAGLGTLLTGHRPGRMWWVSTATVLVGLWLLLRGDGSLQFDLVGVVACLVAGASYAAYIATTRWLLLAGVPPTAVLAFLFVVGAALLVLASPIENLASPAETLASPTENAASPTKNAASPAETLATPIENPIENPTENPMENVAWLAQPDHAYLALYLGVVATALPYLLWVAGLRSVQTSTAATLSLTEPLTAALLGWLVLREPVTPASLAGAGLVIAGLVIAATSGRSTKRGPRRSTKRGPGRNTSRRSARSPVPGSSP
ncbi:hypothetical protein GCM10022251_73740 [Phytohabitans flavus]|uniref:EamA domain-containing protein n=1 Tax=Phytohabitans flavus TaxID=1076124 RepID=A0A6F8XKW3_9ACTN|nr:EamA family transporter [Phytohabitans flavus]BCB74452.1 hypothetical protein Pflav_008620 [Phytohabitans flavus]